jgi:hypothetical protein
MCSVFIGWDKKDWRKNQKKEHTTFQLAREDILSVLMAATQAAAGKPTRSHKSHNSAVRLRPKASYNAHSVPIIFLTTVFLVT